MHNSSRNTLVVHDIVRASLHNLTLPQALSIQDLKGQRHDKGFSKPLDDHFFNVGRSHQKVTVNQKVHVPLIASVNRTLTGVPLVHHGTAKGFDCWLSSGNSSSTNRWSPPQLVQILAFVPFAQPQSIVRLVSNVLNGRFFKYHDLIGQIGCQEREGVGLEHQVTTIKQEQPRPWRVEGRPGPVILKTELREFTMRSRIWKIATNLLVNKHLEYLAPNLNLDLLADQLGRVDN
mmetsp:Transcript_8991/g.15001  ORF Transcript_8991/g.15001 Transcript_8991/m.15001 type:complete len:233 (-) Transcript_8991:693-1391(-)